MEKINQSVGEYCHGNLASLEATVPVEITNQNEGVYFDKNLESLEELSTDYHDTNIEYEQQINDLSSKTDKLDIAFVTSKQIKYFIEQMVLKGAERRRNNPGIDEEWFSVERQCLVRKQLLKRCYAVSESNLSLPIFFRKFSLDLFGETYD